jgi:putative transposase
MMTRRVLRLTYLGMTNALAILRLLPMSDRDKDTEILVLRHQIMALHRQLGSEKVRFDPTDRALLTALLHRLPIDRLHRLRLLVRPDTVPAVASRPHRPSPRGRLRPKRAGRPRTLRSIRALVVRLAREDPRLAACWGSWAAPAWSVPERSLSTCATLLRWDRRSGIPPQHCGVGRCVP